MMDIMDSIVVVESMLKLREEDVVYKQSFGLLDIHINAIKSLLKDCKDRYGFEKRNCICKNCGKPFIAKIRTDTYYCDRPSPQDSTKTCKEYGSYHAWLARAKDKDDWYSLYRKLYLRLQGRVRKDRPHTKVDEVFFENFKEEGMKWKKDVSKKLKSTDEFIEWLNYYFAKAEAIKIAEVSVGKKDCNDINKVFAETDDIMKHCYRKKTEI